MFATETNQFFLENDTQSFLFKEDDSSLDLSGNKNTSIFENNNIMTPSTPSSISDANSTPQRVRINVNISARFSLKYPIDLKAIQPRILGAEYIHSSKILRVRVRKSKMVIELKENGKGTLQFADNEEDALLACRRLGRQIQKKGVSVKF
mmetsp:Transcript_2908/g.2494  ORF Transcript_2908/g.2494 Transcript_2908/m.2494 type:complete len:150 (+) Transcript_2908:67-516(+)